MKTEEIFKQIYQDLKEKIESKDNETFIKEYTIPSINYSDNDNKEDSYFDIVKSYMKNNEKEH